MIGNSGLANRHPANRRWGALYGGIAGQVLGDVLFIGFLFAVAPHWVPPIPPLTLGLIVIFAPVPFGALYGFLSPDPVIAVAHALLPGLVRDSESRERRLAQNDRSMSGKRRMRFSVATAVL